ncbi:hypothetical protein Tco_0072499 [Tanacetum coccineum]
MAGAGSKDRPRCLDQEVHLEKVLTPYDSHSLTQVKQQRKLNYNSSAHQDAETNNQMDNTRKTFTFKLEKEAIFLIWTGIGDVIYSSVDAWLSQLMDDVDCQGMMAYIRVNRCKLRYSFRDGLARSANPLALLAAAQPYLDNYYQAPKLKDECTYTAIIFTRPSASTRHKGQRDRQTVILLSIESVSKEEVIQNKLGGIRYENELALLAKTKTEDIHQYNQRQSVKGDVGNQRSMTVAGARETVGIR